MLDSAAELLGYEGDPQDLLEYVTANPEIAEDAVEHMSGGEGQYLRMWRQQQSEGSRFWGTGGGGGVFG